jgi:hypothetical protein
MNEIMPISQTAVTVQPSNESALAHISASREVTEAQAAVMVAKRFPRDEMEVLDKILISCQRPALAESALYSYSKGGTAINGASIRMAETLIRLWGNASYGLRELESKPNESVIEAFAVDYETNVRQVKVFTVKHERTAKGKTVALTDSRDRYENLANFGARRLRACILGLIPSDIVESAIEQVEETLKAKADTSPEAMKKMVEKFGDYNVTKEQIEKRIQRRIDAITPAQVVSLRKIFNSLKDAMSTASDWFETTAAVEVELTTKTTGNAGLKSALKSKPSPVQEPAKEAPKIACPREPGETRYVETCNTGTCPDKANCAALYEYLGAKA